MEKLKLISPWTNFYHEVDALFKSDPDVNVKFDEEAYELKLFVKDPRKAEALEYILPHEQLFGNVTVKVSIVPANKPIKNVEEALKYAFKGNTIFNFTKTVTTPFGEFNYAVFKPWVLQYHNDDIGDIDGKRTETVEHIAKEVLTLGDSWHICSSFDYCADSFYSVDNDRVL